MNNNKILKIVNPIFAILLLNQAISGFLHDDLPHEVFEFLHTGGWLLIVLAIIHVYLNWDWVKANFLPGTEKGRN